MIDAFIWGWLQILFLKAFLQDTDTGMALDSDNAPSAGAPPCRNVSNFGISVPVSLPGCWVSTSSSPEAWLHPSSELGGYRQWLLNKVTINLLPA